MVNKVLAEVTERIVARSAGPRARYLARIAAAAAKLAGAGVRCRLFAGHRRWRPFSGDGAWRASDRRDPPLLPDLPLGGAGRSNRRSLSRDRIAPGRPSSRGWIRLPPIRAPRKRPRLRRAPCSRPLKTG